MGRIKPPESLLVHTPKSFSASVLTLQLSFQVHLQCWDDTSPPLKFYYLLLQLFCYSLPPHTRMHISTYSRKVSNVLLFLTWVEMGALCWGFGDCYLLSCLLWKRFH